MAKHVAKGLKLKGLSRRSSRPLNVRWKTTHRATPLCTPPSTQPVSKMTLTEDVARIVVTYLALHRSVNKATSLSLSAHTLRRTFTSKFKTSGMEELLRRTLEDLGFVDGEGGRVGAPHLMNRLMEAYDAIGDKQAVDNAVGLLGGRLFGATAGIDLPEPTKRGETLLAVVPKDKYMYALRGLVDGGRARKYRDNGKQLIAYRTHGINEAGLIVNVLGCRFFRPGAPPVISSLCPPLREPLVDKQGCAHRAKVVWPVSKRCRWCVIKLTSSHTCIVPQRALPLHDDVQHEVARAVAMGDSTLNKVTVAVQSALLECKGVVDEKLKALYSGLCHPRAVKHVSTHGAVHQTPNRATQLRMTASSGGKARIVLHELADKLQGLTSFDEEAARAEMSGPSLLTAKEAARIAGLLAVSNDLVAASGFYRVRSGAAGRMKASRCRAAVVAADDSETSDSDDEDFTCSDSSSVDSSDGESVAAVDEDELADLRREGSDLRDDAPWSEQDDLGQAVGGERLADAGSSANEDVNTQVREYEDEPVLVVSLNPGVELCPELRDADSPSRAVSVVFSSLATLTESLRQGRIDAPLGNVRQASLPATPVRGRGAAAGVSFEATGVSSDSDSDTASDASEDRDQGPAAPVMSHSELCNLLSTPSHAGQRIPAGLAHLLSDVPLRTLADVAVDDASQNAPTTMDARACHGATVGALPFPRAESGGTRRRRRVKESVPLDLESASPATLRLAMGMVGNCVSATRWFLNKADINKQSAQSSTIGSGETLIDCLNEYGQTGEGVFYAKMYRQGRAIRVESLVAAIQPDAARALVAANPGMARVVSLDSTFGTSKHDAPLFTYVARHPSTSAMVPVLACVVYGGRSTPNFVTNAIAFMHEAWQSWGNPPVSTFLMDKDAAEWAGLLAFRKQQLAADKDTDFTELATLIGDLLSQPPDKLESYVAVAERFLRAWETGEELPVYDAKTWPPALKGTNASTRTDAMERLFRPDICRRIRPLLPYMALLIQRRLVDCCELAAAACSVGQWEQAWHPLRRLSSLLRKSGAHVTGLAQFFARHIDPRARLCIWHAKQAVSRFVWKVLGQSEQAKTVDAAFEAALMAGSVQDFDKAAANLITVATAAVSPEDPASRVQRPAGERLAEYFKTKWLDERWRELWPLAFRHFACFHLRTTGVSESFHSLYKVFAGLRRTIPAVLFWLMGPPRGRKWEGMSLLQLLLANVERRLTLAQDVIQPVRIRDVRGFIDRFIPHLSEAEDALSSAVCDTRGVFTFTYPASLDAQSPAVIVTATTDPVFQRCSCSEGVRARSGDAMCRHIYLAQLLAVTRPAGLKVPHAAAGETPTRSLYDDFELIAVMGPCFARETASLPGSAGGSTPFPAVTPQRAPAAVTFLPERPAVVPYQSMTMSGQSTRIARESATSPGVVASPDASRFLATNVATRLAAAMHKELPTVLDARPLLARLGYSAQFIVAYEVMKNEAKFPAARAMEPAETSGSRAEEPARRVTVSHVQEALKTSKACCRKDIPSALFKTVECRACKSLFHLECLGTGGKALLERGQCNRCLPGALKQSAPYYDQRTATASCNLYHALLGPLNGKDAKRMCETFAANPLEPPAPPAVPAEEALPRGTWVTMGRQPSWRGGGGSAPSTTVN